MKLRRSFYARPEIIRGQQCAEAPLGPGGATKQLHGRARAISRWKVASPPSLHGLRGTAGAVHTNTVGRPSARSLSVVAQEVRLPAAASSANPRPRPASGVQCPVRATSVHTCLSRRPVSSVRCGRLSVQVSAVRRPLWASGVCALPRPLCPAGVRSWSAAVGRQPYGWDGRGRRGRPLRPCPARGLPESAPRLEAGAGAAGPAEASVWTWPSSWEVVGHGQVDRVADQDRPGAREDRSLVGAGARRGLPSAAG